MKKILLALLLPFAAAAQTSVQKVGSGNNTVSNGAIVIGSNNSLTATGTGIIAATTVPNITISTTAPLAGGGPLTGNLTLSMPFAASLVDGYLKAADWTTFNAKQPAGNYITALTGDGTAAGPGSSALTLATVNTNVGTFASSTVNGKGLVTAAGNLTGDITTSGAAATLATVNSNAGTFAGITLNGKGLATAASNLTINTTAPITGGGILGNLTFAMPAASSTVNGYLTSTDWNTFNGKENVLTFSAPLSRTTNAISIPVSTNSVDGYLSGADHTTFAAKQPAGNYLTALTGDGTAAGPGSSALTLATVNADVGTFAGITLNGKGLATGASSLTIATTAPLTGGGTLGNLTIAEPASTNSVDGYLTAADHTTFAAKQPAGNYITALTGDATAAGPGSSALTLATVATGATTGSSTAIPVVTFNNKGLVTGVATAAVVAPAGTITGTTLAGNVVSSSLTGLGNVTTGTWSADVIAVAKGGTNLSSYTTGDLIYATGATTIGKLPDVAAGSVLTSGGVGALPTYTALSGVAVTGITGTTNQIAVSASTGSVTLSIPTNPTLPGNVTATGTSTATALIAAGNPQLTAVNSIAALESLVVTSLTTNTSINVLGYYTPNDGGGGLFTFTTSSSATVDHGLVCSTPSGGTTRWLRFYSESVNAKWFGAYGNGISYASSSVSITATQHTLTVTGGSFTAGDVGKLISVPGAGTAGANLNTTISAYTSATQVTLTAAAVTTLSAVAKTINYGTDDTTALQNAMNGAQNSYATIPHGIKLIIPSGQYETTAQLTMGVKNSYCVGFSIEGSGNGSTLIQAAGTFASTTGVVLFQNASGFTMKGVTFDANNNAAFAAWFTTAPQSFEPGTSDATITNVYFVNAITSNVQLGTALSESPSRDVSNLTFITCNFGSSVAGYGVSILSYNALINRFVQCIWYGNSTGLYVGQGEATIDYGQMVGQITQDIYVANGSIVSVDGLACEQGTGHFITSDANNGAGTTHINRVRYSDTPGDGHAIDWLNSDAMTITDSTFTGDTVITDPTKVIAINSTFTGSTTKGLVIVGGAIDDGSHAPLQVNGAIKGASFNGATYSSNTAWSPVLNSFTAVGGAPAVTGTYTHFGDLYIVTCQIVPVTSIAATVSTSYVSGLPVPIQALAGVCSWVDEGTQTTLGQAGVVNSAAFTPTIVATAHTIIMTTVYSK